jgi:hypothetical protein
MCDFCHSIICQSVFPYLCALPESVGTRIVNKKEPHRIAPEPCNLRYTSEPFTSMPASRTAASEAVKLAPARFTDHLERLVKLLEDAKSQFGPTAAAALDKLLAQLSRQTFPDPASLIRFHEALLFFRAFPPGPSLIPKLEKLLTTFSVRVDHLRSLGANMSAFDDFDTSGIAGTVMQDALNFDAVRWLARRIPRQIEIAWDDYLGDSANERALGSTWPRVMPLLAEDSDVEANIPWTRWLDSARGPERPLGWLLRRFEELPVEADPGEKNQKRGKRKQTKEERQYQHDRKDRVRGALYDALRLPVRWNLDNLRLSRTRNRKRPRNVFYHREPLITRSQVSLARELSQPAPRLAKLSRRDGEPVMHTIREVMAVRYRELYGTTLGDPASVARATLGRGVVIHLWNLPPARRLPLRAYVAGFTLKNGVPINYIEAIGLCEWIEVGFNTFYTYRQGETAWIYAQALRCLCAFTGARCISVYPYQIGQSNDEAIDSGAFWFYRKLGFRSGRSDLEQLARNEEQKIAANPEYRTPARILRRLAEAHVFYDLPNAIPSAWDTFSTRNLALRVNRCMAREFSGDSVRLRRASIAEVSRALGVDQLRWNPAEQHSFENWSLVLAQIPNLDRWSPEEKKGAAEIIRAQAGANEMRYLHLTQHHPRLRKELLHLGS